MSRQAGLGELAGKTQPFDRSALAPSYSLFFLSLYFLYRPMRFEVREPSANDKVPDGSPTSRTSVTRHHATILLTRLKIIAIELCSGASTIELSAELTRGKSCQRK